MAIVQRLVKRLVGDLDGDSIPPEHREALEKLDGRIEALGVRFHATEQEIAARVRAIQYRKDLIGRDKDD